MDHIGDAGKRANVVRELALLGGYGGCFEGLFAVPAPSTSSKASCGPLMQPCGISKIAIRLLRGSVPISAQKFVELARKVYETNDRRAALKREIKFVVSLRHRRGKNPTPPEPPQLVSHGCSCVAQSSSEAACQAVIGASSGKLYLIRRLTSQD